MSAAADDSSMGARTGDEPQQRRPSLEGGSERKRRRKVLSCFDCRRRKLQCDRALPACGRCTKAGNAASCLYVDDVSDETGTKTVSETRADTRKVVSDTAGRARVPHDSLARLEYQEQRIKQLEAALAQAGVSAHAPASHHHQPLTPESVIDQRAAIIDRESICLRGKSFKTQFSGSTHPGAMVSHITQVSDFMKDAFEHFPALQRMRKDVHALDDRLGVDDAALPQIRDEDVRLALPNRAEADELIHLYIDTFDPVYHIIHLPTFWKSYDEMWTDLTATSAHFVALTLMMMACVSCLMTTREPWTYRAFSSSVRVRSINWIRYCEDWISRQSQKHVSSTDFQIRALLWLAKQTSARKAKRTWTEAGTLIRFCMSAGLHRHPDLLPKQTSQLDKELRKRIWATAVDFELQASFERGMVSAPWLLQSDTSGPANVFDEDIDSERPSMSRSAQEFTPSAYLHVANDSLMLRSTLNAVLNNIRQTLSFDEVKQYTEEIDSHIRSIPDWQHRSSDVPKAMLSLRLRQYLLVLHDRSLRQSGTQMEKYFSKSILLETSLQIIETHKSLLAKEKLALELYCSDALRVAVSIAHLQTYVDAQADLAFSRVFDLVTPQLMTDAVDMARERLLRFGRDGRQLWIVLTCDGIIKSTRHPAQRSTFLQQAVDNVLSPVYKVMASQEHQITDVVNGTQLAPMAPEVPMMDPTLLDMDDLAEWTLQDWFSIGDFSSLSGNGLTSVPTYTT